MCTCERGEYAVRYRRSDTWMNPLEAGSPKCTRNAVFCSEREWIFVLAARETRGLHAHINASRVFNEWVSIGETITAALLIRMELNYSFTGYVVDSADAVQRHFIRDEVNLLRERSQSIESYQTKKENTFLCWCACAIDRGMRRTWERNRRLSRFVVVGAFSKFEHLLPSSEQQQQHPSFQASCDLIRFSRSSVVINFFPVKSF